MSVSSLHQKFKSAIGMGVLQCQKRLRLSEARRLMLSEGRSVTESALEVGYESVSQFIRDYKKMFGGAPKGDIKALGARLAAEKKLYDSAKKRNKTASPGALFLIPKFK